MASVQPAKEPSMEEILASIRRIMHEDGESPSETEADLASGAPEKAEGENSSANAVAEAAAKPEAKEAAAAPKVAEPEKVAEIESAAEAEEVAADLDQNSVDDLFNDPPSVSPPPSVSNDDEPIDPKAREAQQSEAKEELSEGEPKVTPAEPAKAGQEDDSYALTPEMVRKSESTKAGTNTPNPQAKTEEATPVKSEVATSVETTAFDNLELAPELEEDNEFEVVPGVDEGDLLMADPKQKIDLPEESETIEPDPEPSAPRKKLPSLPESLVSSDVEHQVVGSLSHLSKLHLNPDDPHTLEDLVASLLRPMLKEWLDQNLPEIVNNKVDAEINRLTGGN